MSDAPIVFLDTETDGVHPSRRVWEIGMIRRDGEGERAISMFVEIDLSTADPFGLKVGRFYERHPLGRAITEGVPIYRFEEAMKGTMMASAHAALTVAQWTHGAHIVGAVPNFDTEVLANLLRSQGLTPSWHYHLVDVENLMVGYLAARGTRMPPPWRSDELSELVGVAPPEADERHTALGDARWAARIYDAVMGGAA